MRCRMVFLALALVVTQLDAVAPVRAQLVLDHDGDASVRGFHGTKPAGGVKRSFQSDSEARAELDRILQAVGLNFIGDRIALRASAETGNAEAGITKKGDRYIFYNATFMQKLKERTTDQWSLVSVLAHEIGHHVAFHTELIGNDHKFELEADYFSGFVLRRLGASLDQSHAAMRAISPKEATPTHPGLDQRLQVITIGWSDGGGQGAPRGLKERPPDRPSIPVAVVPPPETNSCRGSALACTRANKARQNDSVSVCRLAVECDPGNARSRLDLGQALVIAGQTDEALRQLAEAQQLGVTHGDRRILAMAYYVQADAYGTRGLLERAVALAIQSSEISRELNDRDGEGNAMRLVGEIRVQQQDIAGAQAAFLQALPLCVEAQNRKCQAQIHLTLGKLRLRAGQRTDGCEHWRNSVRLWNELGDANQRAGGDEAMRRERC